jgi:hypothetical protein
MKKIKTFQLFEKKSQKDLSDILNKHISLNMVSNINFEISELLISFGAIPEKENILISFLTIHAYDKYFKQFDIFSEYFDINDTYYINGGYPKETLLSMAIHNSKNLIAAELVRRGANINIKTRHNDDLIDFLDDEDIETINKKNPGFKTKINKLRKTRKFNL